MRQSMIIVNLLFLLVVNFAYADDASEQTIVIEQNRNITGADISNKNVFIQSGNTIWTEGDIDVAKNRSITISGNASLTNSTNSTKLNLDGKLILQKVITDFPTLNLNNSVIQNPLFEKNIFEDEEYLGDIKVKKDQNGNYYPYTQEKYYKPKEVKKIKIIDKYCDGLTTHLNWYIVQELQDDISQEESAQSGVINELIQKLKALREIVQAFKDYLGAVELKNINTMSDIGMSIAQAAYIYATENTYTKFPDDIIFLVQHYYNLAKARRDDSYAYINSTAADAYLYEPYAFVSAYESLCWSHVAWLTLNNRSPKEDEDGGPINKLDSSVEIFDQTGIPKDVIRCFDYAYEKEPRLSTYKNHISSFAESDKYSLKNTYKCGKNKLYPASDTYNGLVRHNGLHMHYIGDFSTLGNAGGPWFYDTSSKSFSRDSYNYNPSTQIMTHSQGTWRLTLNSLSPVLEKILSILPAPETSMTGQTLLGLTGLYYDTESHSEDEVIEGSLTIYEASTEGIVDMSSLRSIISDQLVSDSDKKTTDLSSKIQNITIEKIPEVRLPFNCKFSNITLTNIDRVSYTVLKYMQGGQIQILNNIIRKANSENAIFYGDYSESQSEFGITINNSTIDKSTIIFQDVSAVMNLEDLVNSNYYNKTDYKLLVNDLDNRKVIIYGKTMFNFGFIGDKPITISGAKSVFTGDNKDYTHMDNSLTLPNEVEFAGNNSLFSITQTYGHGTFSGSYTNEIPEGKTVTFSNGFSLETGHTLIVKGKLVI